MPDNFQLLDEFGLGHGNAAKRVRDWTKDEFQSFFEQYEKIAVGTAIVHQRDRGSTDIFPDTIASHLPISTIKQLCVYANRIYIHDPILDLWDDLRGLDANFLTVLRNPSPADRLELYRNDFCKGIEGLLELRPLVELGVLHISPTQLLLPRREAGALYATDLYGADGPMEESPRIELPPALSKYINDNICVSSVEVNDGKLRIFPPGKVAYELPTLARAIAR